MKAGAQAVRRGRAVRSAKRVRASKPAPASADAGPVVLGPALTIAEVAQRARALAAMLECGTAQADAHSLESIDTAGLQLLLATAAAARQRGLTLTLHGAPPLLVGAADALGLGADLMAAVELPA